MHFVTSAIPIILPQNEKSSDGELLEIKARSLKNSALQTSGSQRDMVLNAPEAPRTALF